MLFSQGLFLAFIRLAALTKPNQPGLTSQPLAKKGCIWMNHSSHCDWLTQQMTAASDVWTPYYPCYWHWHTFLKGFSSIKGKIDRRHSDCLSSLVCVYVCARLHNFSVLAISTKYWNLHCSYLYDLTFYLMNVAMLVHSIAADTNTHVGPE